MHAREPSPSRGRPRAVVVRLDAAGYGGLRRECGEAARRPADGPVRPRAGQGAGGTVPVAARALPASRSPLPWLRERWGSRGAERRESS